MEAPVGRVQELKPGGRGVQAGRDWGERERVLLVLQAGELLEVLLRGVRGRHPGVSVANWFVPRVH